MLLVPLDPVHDVGLKLIARALHNAGHETTILPPDLSLEEIISKAKATSPDYIMVSRTISYGTAEVLARFVDLCDASGIREHAKLVVGGLSMRPEMAQEYGFDAGFGPNTTPEEVVAWVDGKRIETASARHSLTKPDITQGYSYAFRDTEAGELCYDIAQTILEWAGNKTTAGIERAKVRADLEEARAQGDESSAKELLAKYAGLTSGDVRKWYDLGIPVPHTRALTASEISLIESLSLESPLPPGQKPLEGRTVMVQYGTGCPVMDAQHIALSLAWGARGVVHFDPSWGARTEGLLEGAWSHQHDGTVLTLENLKLIKRAIHPGALWQVRAHRGLNTPETVVLAHLAGADLTKVNIVYGSLGAGSDPARLTVDGVEAMRLAARYGMPFDVVTNEELCGVPARKAFAGMLIVATVGLMLGGRPVLQPLFANSPEAMVRGLSEDNFVDFNYAKMAVLREIIDAPIWPGAPVGFMTQTPDRCQSATMTALHAALALNLGASAVTIASSDEAYAGGPISAHARVDTLKSTAAALRFFGSSGIGATPRGDVYASELREGIMETLRRVRERRDFVAALYEGLLGDKDDGAYPGRAGKDTVREIR
ncbi:MAG TPA: cobalamin-binding protein [Firmicutes bacterium]|nr:cobalamin-binding protein [Candidatus Fermentithermobacillaceae bacterium]